MADKKIPASSPAPPTAQGPIAIEQTPSNVNDSAVGDFDIESYTTSMTSSITSYHMEHGRRYHAYQAGSKYEKSLMEMLIKDVQSIGYILPNDELEQDRMDLQYHAMRLAFGDKPYFAPIEDNPKAILDIGTGTGIWAIDIADLHTETEIIGTDLSPIQPRWIPPNVKFEIDDAEQQWTYPENHFDLIHTRIMNGSIRDWPRFFEQSLRHCRPGGWVECHELDVDARSDDNSLSPDSYIKKWCANQEEAIHKLGMSLRIDGNQLSKWMENAGFINVTTREFKVPIGPWPADPKLRETGAFQLVAMLDGLQGLTLALWTRFLEWNEEDIENFLDKTRAEWKSNKIHSYWPVYVAYGQKPST